GRNAVVQLLVDHGARLDARDNGSRDTVSGALLGHNWLPVDYAEGLVRVGVQSAIAHPETAALLRKLMTDAGLPIPPPITGSVCEGPLCGPGRAGSSACSAVSAFKPSSSSCVFVRFVIFVVERFVPGSTTGCSRALAPCLAGGAHPGCSPGRCTP